VDVRRPLLVNLDVAAVEVFAPSSVRNAILPLRAIYRRALDRGDVAVNPTLKLSLPELKAGRERVARAAEAASLIATLPLGDRALWATAVYAGLRRGELQALDWSSVDLEQGLIRVERSWDCRAGLIEPKSTSGKRRVPIPEALRSHLLTHRLQQGRGGRGLVFAGRNGRPFDPGSVAARARTAWARAGLKPIGLHDCRHTYAAFMIAANVNAKALSSYMGHSTITVTLDRYGHLLPGNEPGSRSAPRYMARAGKRTRLTSLTATPEPRHHAPSRPE
jgi:integrase